MERHQSHDQSHDQSHHRLIIFTRYPIAGQAKTRLIPALGPEGAAQLQRQMTERTIALAQDCAVPFVIAYCGGTLGQMQDWLGAGLNYQPQAAGDLGDRMASAFADGFVADGFVADGAGLRLTGDHRVVIIGTDCVELDVAIIKQAFTALDDCDLVLGPAIDGGYYLIGLRQSHPELFQNIAWSTDAVLSMTLGIARERSLSYILLPTLSDIDTPADLKHLHAIEHLNSQ
jgi:uncharacterized protein